MEPMSTSKKTLMWICLYPIDKNSSKWMKFVYGIYLFSILAFLTSGVAFTIATLLKYWSIDLEKCLYSPIQLGPTLSTIYSLLIALLIRNKILAMFDHLSEIYKTSEQVDANGNVKVPMALTRANDKIEWIWKIYLKCVFVIIPSNMFFLAAISVLIGFAISGHFDIKFTYHPFILVMPWNQETELGYLAEICHSIVVTVYYLYCNGVFLLTFIGLCLHHYAFYEIFQQILRDTDDERKNGINLLVRLVRFHIAVKSWFADTGEVYSLIFLVQLICNMLVLTSSVFQLDLQIRAGFGMELSILFLAVLNGVANLFLYCYFGKTASESYEKMANSLYESNWRRLPIALQKRFCMIMINAQKPMHYSGFQVVVLNLETFCAFMRATMTYYTMFKPFSTN